MVTVLQVEGLLEHSQTRSLQPFVKLRLMCGSEGEEVEDCTDEEVRVSTETTASYLGKYTAFLFHFYAFGPVCKNQSCSVSELYKDVMEYCCDPLRTKGRHLSCGRCCRSGGLAL